MVKDHMIRSRVFCSWNIRRRRNLNDWEIEEMGVVVGGSESAIALGTWTSRIRWFGFWTKRMASLLLCPPNPFSFPGDCV